LTDEVPGVMALLGVVDTDITSAFTGIHSEGQESIRASTERVLCAYGTSRVDWSDLKYSARRELIG